MTEQSISCPSCGKKIPLTRALRAEIEQSVKQEFDEALRSLGLGLGGSPGWAGRGAASKLAGCNFASSA